MEPAAEGNENSRVTVVDHPLAAAKLAVLRERTTGTEQFRRTLQELSLLLLAEASRCWSAAAIEIETPLQRCSGAVLAQRVVLVPILRAGLGMAEAMARIIPGAQVGHLGLYRDEETLRPVTYYKRLPGNIADAQVLLLDPMLATGNSACEAVSILKGRGVRGVQFICVVACPTGIAQLHGAHPDVPIVAAAIDPGLNDRGYIVPGLGDAGDRYFGT
ncbi:MAG: uracil phosphoribosyltransferase [Chthoniobacterales bacterium]